MKTTIEIADGLLREARRIAECEGTTLRSLVEDGLRTVIAAHREHRTEYELPDLSFGEGGLREGLEWSDWPRLRDLAYGLDTSVK